MVKQKILCILLVFILVFGISISSFASNVNSVNNQIQNNQNGQKQDNNTNQDKNNQQTSNDPLENLNQQK